MVFDNKQQVMEYVSERIKETCVRPLFGQPNDAITRQDLLARIMLILKECGADISRVDMRVESEGDEIRFVPRNLYTVVALFFPPLSAECQHLPEEGSVALSNGVIVRYNHSDGASWQPTEPVEYIKLSFVLKEGED
jgi:hypothetical protein